MKITKITTLLTESPLEPHAHGSLYRMFWPAERYVIDFAEDFKSDGWEQFDTSQDAHYFGAWVNPSKRMTLTYAEGDWTLLYCNSVEHYNDEISGMIRFYEEGQIATAIDMGNGSVTVLRQDRSKFYIKTEAA